MKKILLAVSGVVAGLLLLYLLKVIGYQLGYPKILGIPYYPSLLIISVFILTPLIYWVLKKSK